MTYRCLVLLARCVIHKLLVDDARAVLGVAFLCLLRSGCLGTSTFTTGLTPLLWGAGDPPVGRGRVLPRVSSSAPWRPTPVLPVQRPTSPSREALLPRRVRPVKTVLFGLSSTTLVSPTPSREPG